MGNAHYDVGLACLNGHSVNSSAMHNPEHNSKFCDQCGEPTIDACQSCGTKIRGYCYVPGVIDFSGWKIPAHCHECGKPYPWTDRKAKALIDAIDEVDELTEPEREKLKESVPDVLNETTGTQTAAARFKKAIAKGGNVGGKLLYDVLTKVAVEAVTKSVGL